jgi:hypothetical protein
VTVPVPRLKPVLVLLMALAFGLSPLLTPDFRGYDATQFPVRLDAPAILPAGYAFGIWGLIYLWLVLHAGFGLWKRADDPAWDGLRAPLILSLAVGAVWLYVAVRDPVWASVLIALMLAGALVALLRAPSVPDRWLLLAPLAIYAGWLTAATGVSLGVLLAGFGWLSDTGAAAVMLGVVLALAVFVQRRLGRAPEYALTVVWALIAVCARNGAGNLVVTALAAAGCVVMLAAAWRVRRGRSP